MDAGQLRTIEMNFLPEVKVLCESCGGKRFNPQTLEVLWKGKSAGDILQMQVREAVEFFASTPSMLMPLMSIWFGFIVPLGLSIYWLTQSLFGIVQDVFLTKHYRKIYDAEDVVRREKAAQRAAEEAEKERIRAARRAANPEVFAPPLYPHLSCSPSRDNVYHHS